MPTSSWAASAAATGGGGTDRSLRTRLSGPGLRTRQLARLGPRSPASPAGSRWTSGPCLKLRFFSLLEGWRGSFVSPPAHHGRWGRQDELYPGKKEKKKSLCPPRDCLHSLADVGVGWAGGGQGPLCSWARAGVCWGAQDLGRPAGEDGLGKGGVSLVLGRAPRGDQALWMGVGDNLTCTRGCFWNQAWGLYSPRL